MSKQIKVALIGNPNTGKTSVFNALTGLNQKVGNWKPARLMIAATGTVTTTGRLRTSLTAPFRVTNGKTQSCRIHAQDTPMK